METIREVLMRRDGLSAAEASAQIAEARGAILEALAEGEDVEEVFTDYFGLEPDYLFDVELGLLS